MLTNACCHNASEQLPERSRSRIIATTKWLVPTAMLALMPKCPMCVAAYIALGTGFGISVHFAAWIRGGLILICLASLAWFATATVQRVFASRRCCPGSTG